MMRQEFANADEAMDAIVEGHEYRTQYVVSSDASKGTYYERAVRARKWLRAVFHYAQERGWPDRPMPTKEELEYKASIRMHNHWYTWWLGPTGGDLQLQAAVDLINPIHKFALLMNKEVADDAPLDTDDSQDWPSAARFTQEEIDENARKYIQAVAKHDRLLRTRHLYHPDGPMEGAGFGGPNAD